MAETASFVIGGVKHDLGPLTLYTLKRCWEGSVLRLSQPPTKSVQDRFERMDAVLSLVATALTAQGTPTQPDALEMRVTTAEWAALDASVIELFRISGMLPEGGKTGEAEAASPSTETGTD